MSRRQYLGGGLSVTRFTASHSAVAMDRTGFELRKTYTPDAGWRLVLAPGAEVLRAHLPTRRHAVTREDAEALAVGAFRAWDAARRLGEVS